MGSWPRWKAAEKKVAESFGGTRHVRTSYSESSVDVEHTHYSVEVKYGKQIPSFLKVKDAFALITDDNEWVVMYVPSGKSFNSMININFYDGWFPKIRKKKSIFLDRAFMQARRYAPDKIPVVALVFPNMNGYVAVVSREDFRSCSVYS